MANDDDDRRVWCGEMAEDHAMHSKNGIVSMVIYGILIFIV